MQNIGWRVESLIVEAPFRLYQLCHSSTARAYDIISDPIDARDLKCLKHWELPFKYSGGVSSSTSPGQPTFILQDAY